MVQRLESLYACTVTFVTQSLFISKPLFLVLLPLPRHCSFFLVEIPNGQYNGQNPMKLVRIKTPERIRRMIAVVPETCLVKYNMTIATATSILTIRSIEPMFFFIVLWFYPKASFEDGYDITQICHKMKAVKTTLVTAGHDGNHSCDVSCLHYKMTGNKNSGAAAFVTKGLLYSCPASPSPRPPFV